MTDKIKIGDGEYAPPFTGAYAPQGAHVPVDSTGKVVQIQDDFSALNELVALRAEVERLRSSADEFLVTGTYTRNGAYERFRDALTTNPQPCGESQHRNACTPLE